jgi:hypothetical protein
MPKPEIGLVRGAIIMILFHSGVFYVVSHMYPRAMWGEWVLLSVGIIALLTLLEGLMRFKTFENASAAALKSIVYPATTAAVVLGPRGDGDIQPEGADIGSTRFSAMALYLVVLYVVYFYTGTWLGAIGISAAVAALQVGIGFMWEAAQIDL